MKWFENSKTGLLLSGFCIGFLVMVALFPAINHAAEDVVPIADAGSSRYAGHNPVVLDGTGSYDPDNSGPLIYTWQQISGPSVVISDAETATPTISGFVQTDEIHECEFELVVSDGELTSLPDTVKVIIVPACDENLPQLELKNDPFDPAKPTIIYFGGGGDLMPQFAWSPFRVVPWNRTSPMDPAWLGKANIIECPSGYKRDSSTGPITFYRCGDKIIVYLSAVAPNYKQPIQTVGHSWGGVPAMDVGIYLNQTYKDRRYAVNRLTILDSGGLYWRDPGAEDTTINQFLASSVDGEQCWIDDYWWGDLHVFRNILNVQMPEIGHANVKYWYGASLTYDNMNHFNNGVVAGAYWSVIGPGKNLQLASTGDYTYVFRWPSRFLLHDKAGIELYDEAKYPGRLPEPVTLAGPEDGSFVDVNGALFSCEYSENAVGYQLLFGPDPHRVMDYCIVSDTTNPPSEIVTASPFEPTWWTVKAYDQYGSTIYADPICVSFETLAPPLIENMTTGQRYASIQLAIDDARHGHEIIVSPGTYVGDINFQGKNLTLRSTEPNDSAIVATTIIEGYGEKSVVTFSGGEDANCVLAGLTITSGKYGIYCSGASPTIVNCTITENTNDDMGAGISLKNGSNPVLVNCTIINNSGSLMGGGLYNENSNPILSNCVFSGNSALYFGGGIYSSSGSPTIINCIVWDNIPDEMFMTGSTSVTYSDVKNGFAGEGNIDADPLFADPDNGDYHLKSQAGRWDSINQSWVQDDVTSPCIDAGDPISPVGLEHLSNGGIINMGAYGGTPEASKSP